MEWREQQYVAGLPPGARRSRGNGRAVEDVGAEVECYREDATVNGNGRHDHRRSPAGYQCRRCWCQTAGIAGRSCRWRYAAVCQFALIGESGGLRERQR